MGQRAGIGQQRHSNLANQLVGTWGRLLMHYAHCLSTDKSNFYAVQNLVISLAGGKKKEKKMEKQGALSKKETHKSRKQDERCLGPVVRVTA